MRLLLLLFLSLVLTSCDWGGPKRPSVLVVAIEGLDFDSVPCLETNVELTGGFFEMCRDSVRFTHAYTPSLMSQATLSSILSARYPIEHGVRHNGEQYLTEEIETVPEMAVRRQYRTAFFSGGAPILRKSGLAQGFELFDDNIAVALGRYYRSAAENVRRFKRWLSLEVESSAFFSVIYFNDLQFVNTPTRDEEGLEQSLSRESQLLAIDVALSQLITEMKKQNRWYNTHVFLMGLNGRSLLDRNNEIRGTNLHRENTHVTLMIKPARKKRDEGLAWSIGANVSLVDVGATLFSLVGASDFSFFERAFEVASLTTSMERPVVNWDKNRWILTESAWPEWRQVSNIRSSIRRGSWMYVFDPISRLYNTLSDANELKPLREMGAVATNELQSMQEFLESRGAEVWKELPADLLEKVRIGRTWSKTSDLSKSELMSLKHILKKRPWDIQMVGWMARYFIGKEDWKSLEELSEDHIDDSWVYLSAKLQNKNVEVPSAPCMTMLLRKDTEPEESCQDPLLVRFIEWVASSGTAEESATSKQFLRNYYYAKLDDEIGAVNYMNGLFWDAALDRPGMPNIVDLVMLLPEYRKYKVVADQNLKSLSSLPASNFY